MEIWCTILWDSSKSSWTATATCRPIVYPPQKLSNLGVIKEFFTFCPKSEDSSFYSSLLGPKVKILCFLSFSSLFWKVKNFHFYSSLLGPKVKNKSFSSLFEFFFTFLKSEEKWKVKKNSKSEEKLLFFTFGPKSEE